MVQLKNLDGVRKKLVDAKYFKNAKEAEDIIQSGIAATTAGSNGAINVWEDDKGNVWCSMMQYLEYIDKKIINGTDERRKWIKRNLKIIHNR